MSSVSLRNQAELSPPEQEGPPRIGNQPLSPPPRSQSSDTSAQESQSEGTSDSQSESSESTQLQTGQADAPRTWTRSLIPFENSGSAVLFLLALAVLAFVLGRTWRRTKRDRGRSLEHQVGEVRAWADAALSESGTPLAGAPPEFRRWHVEIEQIVRDARAELDTKIVLLQAVVRSAAAEAERLEKAIAEAKRVSESK